MTLLNVKPFCSQLEAEAYLTEDTGAVSKYRRIQYARTQPVGPRDQSEDRKVTTLVI